MECEKVPLLIKPAKNRVSSESDNGKDENLNGELVSKSGSFRIPIYGTNSPSGKIIPYNERMTFSWSELNVFAHISSSKRKKIQSYFLKKNSRHSSESKQILKDVTGVAYPGELLAIMGSSGAGKTTLLNALTFRTSKAYTVTGRRSINGHSVRQATFINQSAYVQQCDLFIGSLTVKEHLIFQALVRMDKHFTYQQRIQRVNEVMQELSLQKCENTTIGITGRLKGISGGEMKRLSFASEILTNPMLMFCDEPTSGLDSFMALSVVQNLKALAMTGKTVVCTIHQPSSELYAMFDKLLLMSEGRTVFLGTPEEADVFFTKLNAPCPKNFNPADFFVQLLAVMPGKEDESRKSINNFCDEFEKSDLGVQMVAEANNTKENEFMSSDNSISFFHGDRIRSPYKANWIKQFRAVFWRSWMSVIKEPLLIKVRLIQTIILAVFIGMLYLNQDINQEGIMNMNGAMFLFLTNMSFQNAFAVINVFCAELSVFLREHRNGMYRTDIYFLCKTTAEMPLFTIIPILFVGISYYMIGLNHDVGRFFTTCFIMVMVTYAAVSFGYLMSCAASNVGVALSVGPPFIIPCLLFGGYLLNIESIPMYLKWLSYFSWFRYGTEALFINQWTGITSIACDTNATNTGCLTNGEAVLGLYNFHGDNFWPCIMGLAGLTIIFRFLAFLFLLYRSHYAE